MLGEVRPRADVPPADRDAMYALLAEHFDRTSRDRFEADLAEKEQVILLRDPADGSVQGFTTLMTLRTSQDGRPRIAFFSGDTIVSRRYRGETALMRLWVRTVFAEADRAVTACPETRAFWFLICSGYKTWRFLPVFFRRYYPNPFAATPADAGALLQSLALTKFGGQYDADRGVVRFRDAAPLRAGVADLTPERLRDPHVAFFAQRNPGHADGDELACLTETARENLTRAGARMFGLDDVRNSGAGIRGPDAGCEAAHSPRAARHTGDDDETGRRRVCARESRP